MRNNESNLNRSHQNPSAEFYLVAQELQNLLSAKPTDFDSRRKHQRVPRSISISVEPVDADFQSQGEPFWVVSRDISRRGIGLISYDPIRHEFVRIGLLNENISVIGQVRHNTAIGHRYPLYLVGVEFLNEMEI
ncbi:MAG: PilZ domain-containing protein [Planctomycetota bacterium]